ncbi:hypothetical protein D3C72_543620 [compost metagenome]
MLIPFLIRLISLDQSMYDKIDGFNLFAFPEDRRLPGKVARNGRTPKSFRLFIVKITQQRNCTE